MRRVAIAIIVTLLVFGGFTFERTRGIAAPVPRDDTTTTDASTTTTGGETSTTSTTTAILPPVTIGAVGDVEIGTTPALPPQPSLYFAPIEAAMAAPILFGNLEGTLTDSGGSKCAPNSHECFAFRVPVSFASVYRHAGFTVMNSANNHSHDFGDAGVVSTTRALRSAGLVQAGLPGEIGVVSEGATKVAFVDFAPYPNTNDLLNLAAAKRLITRAKSMANLVVVYMHAGAEGADADHVTKKTEMFLGENRGNPYGFAHMAIADGADLVLASGPHVLRGMEFFRGHLIAYSLGDFANYENFDLAGVLDLSAILHVTLSSTGAYLGGRFTSVVLRGAGQPFVDKSNASAKFVNRLSVQDFGRDAAMINLANGEVHPFGAS